MIARSSFIPTADAAWPGFVNPINLGFIKYGAIMGYDAARIADVTKASVYATWAFGSVISLSRAYNRSVTVYKEAVLNGSPAGPPLVPPALPDLGTPPPAISGGLVSFFTILIVSLEANPLCTPQMLAEMGLSRVITPPTDYTGLKAAFTVKALPGEIMEGSFTKGTLQGIQTYIMLPGSTLFVKHQLFPGPHFTYTVPPNVAPAIFEAHLIYGVNVKGGVEIGLPSDIIKVLPRP